MKRHERLSEALCEAVEFGRPIKVRLGHEAFNELLASLTGDSGYKLDLNEPLCFEDVPVEIVRDVTGCLVDHDGRYGCPSAGAGAKAIPESVALDRRTRKPVIVAW